MYGERRTVLMILSARAADGERSQYVQALLADGSARCCSDWSLEVALALSVVVDAITDLQASAAFDYMQNAVLEAPAVSEPIGGAVYAVQADMARREKLTRVVAGMQQLGGRLGRQHARTALRRTLDRLITSPPEEVGLLRPAFFAVIRSGDEPALFDILKQPDARAPAAVHRLMTDALKDRWRFEGSGFWDAVNAAKTHGLDPVAAAASNWHHFLRDAE
jgi:hypothetical protein